MHAPYTIKAHTKQSSSTTILAPLHYGKLNDHTEPDLRSVEELGREALGHHQLFCLKLNFREAVEHEDWGKQVFLKEKSTNSFFAKFRRTTLRKRRICL